jgi:RimJ/RimL family protein N-acetyltransferase
MPLLIPGFTARPIQLDDAPAWAAYVCLPEVMLHTSSTARTVDDVPAEIARTLTGLANAPIRFVLMPEGSEAIVGTVGFHSISVEFGTAEVAYDIAPSHWRKGIASAACRGACLWGFDTHGWHRIQATTVLANLASLHVLGKVVFEGAAPLARERALFGQLPHAERVPGRGGSHRQSDRLGARVVMRGFLMRFWITPAL